MLAPGLLLLALAGLAFVDSGNQRAGATTTSADGLVVSLTCEAVDDQISCRLITARELDQDEGVQFVVTVDGDTRTITATRQTDCDSE
ncbi:MAG: hypothetical protein OXL98_15625, partial [Acidimicrobiaceae bacterium]|nr:hypothetical protein [Acidimicrobiaceae bacterium]